MEKKYTVDEFIKLWEAEEKDEDIKQIADDIFMVYIPYEEKVNRADRIVKSAYYNLDENDKPKFMINSAASYMLYCLTVVDLYSPITIDFSNAVDIYDKLNRNRIIDWIMNKIDERELKEFKMIYDMIGRDEIANYHEIHTFIDKQVRTIADVASAICDPLIEEIKNVINNMDTNELSQIIEQLSAH